MTPKTRSILPASAFGLHFSAMAERTTIGSAASELPKSTTEPEVWVMRYQMHITPVVVAAMSSSGPIDFRIQLGKRPWLTAFVLLLHIQAGASGRLKMLQLARNGNEI